MSPCSCPGCGVVSTESIVFFYLDVDVGRQPCQGSWPSYKGPRVPARHTWAFRLSRLCWPIPVAFLTLQQRKKWSSAQPSPAQANEAPDNLPCIGPVLIVCFTNHALDQFLEGLLAAGLTNLVRVGGRYPAHDVSHVTAPQAASEHKG